MSMVCVITSIIVRKCVKINFINFLDYSFYVIGMIQSLCLIIIILNVIALHYYELKKLKILIKLKVVSALRFSDVS